jgi:hypothetical protein
MTKTMLVVTFLLAQVAIGGHRIYQPPVTAPEPLPVATYNPTWPEYWDSYRVRSVTLVTPANDQRGDTLRPRLAGA